MVPVDLGNVGDIGGTGMRSKVLLIFFVIIIVGVVAAGCRKSSPQSADQPPVAKQAKQGGQLIYGSLQEPSALLPYLSSQISALEVQNLIFSGLVIADNKLEWQPDLAEVVPMRSNGGVSADGLAVTYRLRRGVKWHDGTELTSADVRYTWRFITNPKIPVISRQGYDKITAIDTPDPYTVVVRFKEYYSGYLSLFPFILPQHIVEQQEQDIGKAVFNKEPVGSGPFKFKSWHLADAIYLEANDKYFRGKPRLDKVTYKILPDINIMLTQLKSGAVDVIGNVGLAQLEQFKAISGMQVLFTPNTTWEHLDYNLDNPLFHDIRVRQAILLALDRQNIALTTLKGTAVAATADQPPGTGMFNSGLEPTTRDVVRARNLLAEAGWKIGADGILVKDGKRLAISIVSVTGNKTREYVQAAIGQQLRDVGIEANFTNYPVDYFHGTILRQRKFEMAMYAYVVEGIHVNEKLWSSTMIPGPTNDYTGQNYTGWRNAEIDSLAAAGANNYDQEQRKRGSLRIQQLIAQELPCVPLFFRMNVDVVKNHVVNFKPNPIPAKNLWNAWEWGLLEK